MANDTEVQRQLNEAVIPEKFSLESLRNKTAHTASILFSDEGWSHDDAQTQNLAEIASLVPSRDEFPKGKLAALGDATTRGAVTLVTAGNAEFGLTFGQSGRGRRGDRQPGDAAGVQISQYQPQQEDLDPRRGKSIGFYVGIKF